MRFEFGNLGGGLLYQGKIGVSSAFDSEEGMGDNIRLEELDEQRLAELEIRVQRTLGKMRGEVDRLVKKFDLEASENGGQEIREVMGLDGGALDELQVDIQQRLRGKKNELHRLTEKIDQLIISVTSKKLEGTIL